MIAPGWTSPDTNPCPFRWCQVALAVPDDTLPNGILVTKAGTHDPLAGWRIRGGFKPARVVAWRYFDDYPLGFKPGEPVSPDSPDLVRPV